MIKNAKETKVVNFLTRGIDYGEGLIDPFATKTTVVRVRVYILIFVLLVFFFLTNKFSQFGPALPEELGNIQTHTLTDWCFDREMTILF